ncbi:substrate import-associated zinc metallohydrolase lipoprotein [Flavobacterium cutihirudinis]|uniref:Substrate import-associated zinc metallohydrolase lipoprotein n=1 Tax=Flavobacterium cutihirudinis TaxID=1265740 RepID=A0A3D9G1T8_9FLAO|nr:substrate import-associated zinc metallohydrolase lipoprotein [Flavobacterium cutihirudinis]RED27181.1 substrate import-associated zinc metallohydrolase lipoprotein [Flavobacterium cutihirudinis]
MKLFKYNKIAVLALVSIALVSCGNDDQPGDSQLDYTQPVKTKLDNWITTNYLTPYNINVQYKWNQNTVDNSRYLFPPTIEKVQPALEIVQTIWLKSYATIGGADFVKKIAPREIVLVGGVNLNSVGTRTLGLAEGGQRVTLFETDYIDKSNRENVAEFIHTIQHEYIHILNQNKPFDEKSWTVITPGGYTADWYNYEIPESNELGFITSYARSNINEDFAETASMILIYSKDEYAAFLAGIQSPFALEALKKKEALVVKYFKEAFNMDFYALRDEAEKNTTAVITN